jgi:acyl-CoA reductase-like NAD-dependent aldehyde dehydrogenase
MSGCAFKADKLKATVRLFLKGEVCSNGTRVYVHRSIMAPFVEKVVDATRMLKVGDPMVCAFRGEGIFENG